MTVQINPVQRTINMQYKQESNRKNDFSKAEKEKVTHGFDQIIKTEMVKYKEVIDVRIQAS